MPSSSPAEPSPVSLASSAYRWNILLLLAGSQVIAYIDRVTASCWDRQAVQAVIDAYRKTFEQQSVLRESARVCVAG